MSTSLTKLYKIANDDIKFKITIGQGQIAVSDLYLGKQKIGSEIPNSFERSIQSNEDLKGKSLYCFTIVSDIQTATNQTSITYELTGGVKPFKKLLSESVDEHGETLLYTSTIILY